jgi:hypothetical protein
MSHISVPSVAQAGSQSISGLQVGPPSSSPQAPNTKPHTASNEKIIANFFIVLPPFRLKMGLGNI